jgi:hypothetical protein
VSEEGDIGLTESILFLFRPMWIFGVALSSWYVGVLCRTAYKTLTNYYYESHDEKESHGLTFTPDPAIGDKWSTDKPSVA